jgi:hypothetical protein
VVAIIRDERDGLAHTDAKSWVPGEFELRLVVVFDAFIRRAAGECLGVKVIVVFSTLLAHSKPTASVSASRGLHR